jgi:hypothetical protein
MRITAEDVRRSINAILFSVSRPSGINGRSVIVMRDAALTGRTRNKAGRRGVSGFWGKCSDEMKSAVTWTGWSRVADAVFRKVSFFLG